MVAVGPLQLKTFYSIPFYASCPLPFHPPLPLWAAVATKGKGASPVLGRGGTAVFQRLLLLPLTLRPGAGDTARRGLRCPRGQQQPGSCHRKVRSGTKAAGADAGGSLCLLTSGKTGLAAGPVRPRGDAEGAECQLPRAQGTTGVLLSRSQRKRRETTDTTVPSKGDGQLQCCRQDLSNC